MLAHRLVEAGIGGQTVEELSDTMSVSEFLRWQAYDELRTIGNSNLDLLFGSLKWLLASIYSPKGRTPKLKDFLLGDWPEAAPTSDELEARLDTLATLYGGTE